LMTVGWRCDSATLHALLLQTPCIDHDSSEECVELPLPVSLLIVPDRCRTEHTCMYMDVHARTCIQIRVFAASLAGPASHLIGPQGPKFTSSTTTAGGGLDPWPRSATQRHDVGLKGGRLCTYGATQPTPRTHCIHVCTMHDT